MTTPRPVELKTALIAAERGAVVALVEAAEAVDGAAALNEESLLTLAAGDRGEQHLLGREAGQLAAYLQLRPADAEAAAECVVHPDHRRRGWGEAVVRQALRMARPAPLLMWSHGDHPGAARLARQLGFSRVRELCQMRRDLTEPLDAVEPPAGVTIRSFRVGADEAAWLRVNARAFADHAEQGRLDASDLALRTAAEWFDPAGFFLAERDGRLVGFHWTKVHPGPPPVGEVYVVGVDPDAQGGGLGRALTMAGLRHLRERGLAEVLLYVEADNAPARAVYERLGFRHVASDVRYRHSGARSAQSAT